MQLELVQDIPLVYLAVDNGPPVPVAVDSGSPLLVVDRGPRGTFSDHSLRLLEPLECTRDCHCVGARSLCDSGRGVCVAAPCSQDSDCDKVGQGIKCSVAVGRCERTSAASCQAQASDPYNMLCSGSSASRACTVFNPRFLFRDVELHQLRVQPVGLDEVVPIRGLLGVPLLKWFTVRLDYRQSSMTLLNGMPDTHEDLAEDCSHSALITWTTARLQRCLAVMATARLGGGVITFNGETNELPPTRIAVPMCLLPSPFSRTHDSSGGKLLPHGAEQITGVPVHAVVATGMGVSVISRSAFKRLQAYRPGLTATQSATLRLPYGDEQVFKVTLNPVAMVSNETRWLGPCGELALRRRMAVAPLRGLPAADKALLDDKTFNGASVALVSGDVSFVVLEDRSPLIQGLRNELRPGTPDIDVVLGGSFLKSFTVELDYPGDRTILRCSERGDAEKCDVIPFCAYPDNSDRRQIHCPLEKK